MAHVPLDRDDVLAAKQAAMAESGQLGPKAWVPHWTPETKIRFAEKAAKKLRQIHQKIKADYEDVIGRLILVSRPTGYVDENSIIFDLKTPALVRVVKTSNDDLFHQADKDWIDPYWNIELLEPHQELKEARSLWMYGTSYNIRTGQMDPARFEFP